MATVEARDLKIELLNTYTNQREALVGELVALLEKRKSDAREWRGGPFLQACST